MKTGDDGGDGVVEKLLEKRRQPLYSFNLLSLLRVVDKDDHDSHETTL